MPETFSMSGMLATVLRCEEGNKKTASKGRTDRSGLRRGNSYSLWCIFLLLTVGLKDILRKVSLGDGSGSPWRGTGFPAPRSEWCPGLGSKWREQMVIVLEQSLKGSEALARRRAPQVGGGKGHETPQERPRKTTGYGEGKTWSGTSSKNKASESSHLQRLGRYARI